MRNFRGPLTDWGGGLLVSGGRAPAKSADLAGASVAARHIRKSFDCGQVPVLAGVTVEAIAGEFVAVLGPSGCGKSTLLGIIAGLTDPDAGGILIDGVPAPDRLGRLAYMPQQDALFPWRTILENCLLPAEFQGRDRRAAQAEARDLLVEFGLGEFMDAYPAALSGGMRQRAAFLRTWLAHQSILLLDEPFGALDALTRAGLQRWLLGVWDRHRRTVLLVTHDVDEAIVLADRIYVLTQRPARIAATFLVPFARPRPDDLLLSPEFLHLKARLLGALRADLPG